jgi:predicted NUDIX family NTP pyrophosphohydrolase
MYRKKDGSLQVFLAHPGGPLYRKKDNGHWTIPKGEPPENEPLLETAIREFEEETGLKPRGSFIELGSIRQKGGKIVYAWAFEGDHDPLKPTRSNTFEMEWPPRSGRIQSFPEVDRTQFFSLPEAKVKLKETQWPLIERLAAILEKSDRSAIDL